MKVHKSLVSQVLKHLQTHESIDGIYFALNFGSTRLPRYIELLRKKGHDIKTVEIVANKKYKYVLLK